MKFKLFFVSIISILLAFVTSCNDGDDPRLYLTDFYWAPTTEESDISEAENLVFQKIPKLEYKNIRKLVGASGEYVWIKTTFTLPDELKGDDLSMLVPYIHFAEELYLNGKYIDDYGIMEGGANSSEIQEAGFMAHLFDFPEDFINQEGENTVLIKLFSLGSGSICGKIFVGFRQDAWSTSDKLTFWHSRIYIFLEGIMLCVSIFFLMIFFAYRKERIYIYFSLLNLLSFIFFSTLFAGDLPWVGFHGGINYFWFFKLAKCATFFGLEYLFSLFIFDYLEMKHTLAERIVRGMYLFAAVILCVTAPTYYDLLNISHFIIWLSVIDIQLAIGMILINLRKSVKREKARLLLIILTPFLITVNADFIIKTFANNIELPYYSMYGWIGTVMIFFLSFTSDYQKISKRLEYLNTELKNEVGEQTRQLKEANESLEHEMEIASEDMHMAAIVQQKFFYVPDIEFENWDYAVCYEPLSQVSGDLFNFFYDDNKLNGVSLFDASGHGVAASLITMLSENIIRQVYIDQYQTTESLGQILTNINTSLIDAKGEVDNFLTGILLKITDNDDGTSKINIANAGHPRPFIYKSQEDMVMELQPPNDDYVFGPIGINGIEHNYLDYELQMQSGDVLILYTDGLTETMNIHREDFGKSSVQALLQRNNKKSAKDIMNIIMRKLNEHSSGAPRSDDITAIIIKRK
ncbi:MAG: SpoIIE family protein phosphatase [Treponema sp.]|nr:SpoIIE family protein phosphatase [Treponema sp.]